MLGCNTDLYTIGVGAVFVQYIEVFKHNGNACGYHKVDRAVERAACFEVIVCSDICDAAVINGTDPLFCVVAA